MTGLDREQLVSLPVLNQTTCLIVVNITSYLLENFLYSIDS